MLVMVIVLILIGLGLAIPLALFVVGMQGKARKQAYLLLKDANPDPRVIKKTIKVLAPARDNESQELVRKLMALRN